MLWKVVMRSMMEHAREGTVLRNNRRSLKVTVPFFNCLHMHYCWDRRLPWLQLKWRSWGEELMNYLRSLHLHISLFLVPYNVILTPSHLLLYNCFIIQNCRVLVLIRIVSCLWSIPLYPVNYCNVWIKIYWREFLNNFG